jgi:hypothetical protein
MEVLRVGHSPGNHSRVSNHKRPIGYFFEMHSERRVSEAWHSGEESLEEFLGSVGAYDGQRWPSSSFVFGENHRIEEIGDEVRKVIGVVMGEENVSDSMPVHAGP